jgi:hypothetical protein
VAVFIWSSGQDLSQTLGAIHIYQKEVDEV